MSGQAVFCLFAKICIALTINTFYTLVCYKTLNVFLPNNIKCIPKLLAFHIAVNHHLKQHYSSSGIM